MPFVKGKSGNPGGRPAVSGLVRDLCKGNSKGNIEDIILELYEIALRGKGMVKLEAIKYICDRVAGKPTVTVAGDEENPLKVDAAGALLDSLKAIAKSG
jgi:hypothetical protein